MHAINNGLNAIAMNAELAELLAARGAPSGTASLTDAVQRISQDCRKYSSDTRRLVDFARGGGPVEILSVREVIDRFTGVLASILQLRDVNVNVHVSHPDVEIQANPLDMEQVLLCLVREGREAGASEIAVSTNYNGEEVLIELERNGTQSAADETSPTALRRRFIASALERYRGAYAAAVTGDGRWTDTLRIPVHRNEAAKS